MPRRAIRRGRARELYREGIGAHRRSRAGIYAAAIGGTAALAIGAGALYKFVFADSATVERDSLKVPGIGAPEEPGRDLASSNESQDDDQPLPKVGGGASGRGGGPTGDDPPKPTVGDSPYDLTDAVDALHAYLDARNSRDLERYNRLVTEAKRLSDFPGEMSKMKVRRLNNVSIDGDSATIRATFHVTEWWQGSPVLSDKILDLSFRRDGDEWRYAGSKAVRRRF